jgi:hypothetical protein
MHICVFCRLCVETILLFVDSGAVGKRVGHPWHERDIKLFLFLLCLSKKTYIVSI